MGVGVGVDVGVASGTTAVSGVGVGTGVGVVVGFATKEDDGNDRYSLICRADSGSREIIIRAEYQYVDHAEQHEQRCFDKDRPRQAEQLHFFHNFT